MRVVYYNSVELMARWMLGCCVLAIFGVGSCVSAVFYGIYGGVFERGGGEGGLLCTRTEMENWNSEPYVLNI